MQYPMKALALCFALFASALAATPGTAETIDQPGRAAYLEAMKGKRVIFVPISMGFDLDQAWVAVWQRQAERYGFTLEIRDPNFSTEAGIAALNGAIAEAPDLLIVQNPDIQSYARLLKQATAAGIKVLQINMQSSTPTDSYVGADWIEIGRALALEMVSACGGGKGSSNKIIWLAGVETGAANLFIRAGIDQVLAENPGLDLVSDQPANYDSEKARQITETVLQQHPDLCGIMGIWDNADVGAGAAVQTAGKAEQITVATTGGGNQTACNSIKNGLLDVMISPDSMIQGEIAAQQIAELLQHPERMAGAEQTIFFGPLVRITAQNADSGVCWSLDARK